MIHIPCALRERFACIFTAIAGLAAAGSTPARAAAQEVVFRVGTDAVLDWFVIDNPSIHGTLDVTNAPYASGTPLNAAAVDLGRDRLLFETATATAQGYAISLAGLQLLPNKATPVTVTALGTWPDGGDNAGYRKADGQIYYHPNATDQLRQLDFGPTGLITGSTVVGNFNGNGTPNSITGGDIDFSSNGSIWLSGIDENSVPKLWNFDFTTLNAITAISLNNNYNGMTFNAEGDTLYGYKAQTGNYGIINTTTGAFQSVLDTDTTLFGLGGDLATGTANITIVPEPASLSLMALAALPLLLRRRKA